MIAQAPPPPPSPTVQIPQAQVADTCEYIVNDTHSLEDVLSEIKSRGYDETVTAIITIAEGCTPVITRRWNPLRCNVTIKGAGSSPARIYTATSIYDNPSGLMFPYGSDAVLSFESPSHFRRIKVRLENLEFMPVGQEPGKDFMPSSSPTDAANTTTGAYYIKVYMADAVEMVGVKSTLANGFFGNVDLRSCNNVTITGCEFVNYNGIMSSNREGGTLSVRGTTDNVLVHGNKFRKYGNDEVFSVHMGSVPEPLYADMVDARLTYFARRSHITFTDNEIIYERPTRSDGSLYPSNPNDVLISFLSYEKQPTMWSDILFAGNKVECRDYVKRILSINYTPTTAEAHDVRIIGNEFVRDYTRTDLDAWCYDLCLRSSGPVADGVEAVEAAGNRFVARHKMGASTIGYALCYVEGSNLDFHDNYADATAMTVVGANDYQGLGVVPLRVDYYSSRVNMHGNELCGVGYLAFVGASTAANSATADTDPHHSIVLQDNYVYGHSHINFASSSAPRTNLRLSGNYFHTSSYTLLLQGYSQGGRLWVDNNVWDTYLPAGTTGAQVTFFSDYQGVGGHNLEQVTFMHNVVTGERYAPAVALPAAASVVITDNELGARE